MASTMHCLKCHTEDIHGEPRPVKCPSCGGQMAIKVK